MAIAIGQQLGSHEITSLLGKGGMGEVYRARDLKLKREVAIKILPEEFSLDKDRVSRFQREAEVLASLNHPNIAAIHDLEETNGTRYLVLELVEGETLADRIARGPIPVEEALDIAKHICAALEAAHEKGIIHRDLKPANVKITPDGKVKVLDFGLARAADVSASNPNLSNSPTMLSMAATNVGVILGTAAYMSPEQAKGRAVDRRADIFAFGAVLYEMLTAKRAFDGDDVTDILGAVLRIEPDWTQLPESLPAGVRRLLRLCLEKNPKNRRSDATDVRLDIEHMLQEPANTPTSKTVEILKLPLWRRAIPVVSALIAGGVIAGAAIWNARPTSTLPVMKFSIALPEGQAFTNTGRQLVAISPDGAQMVYVANLRLYLRNMSDLEARPIPGIEKFQAVLNPVFSPDGRSIVFWATPDRTLQRIALSGGASLSLCSANNLMGMSWGPDGIVFGEGRGGIKKVSENGGKPELIASVESGELAHGPQILPGGGAVLYTVSMGNNMWDKAKIFVQRLKPAGGRKLIIDGGSDARYVPTGHIVYAYQGTLFAIPFDLKRLEVTGGPVPVVEGVRRAAPTGTAQFSFSNNGSLVYVPGPVSAGEGGQSTLGVLDRNGQLERLKLPLKAYAFPRLSPDGKQVAVSTDDKDANVWIVNLAGDTAPRQLTLGGTNRYPVWSWDGKRIAFQSDREGDLGIFWQNADGTGTAERLTKADSGTTHIPDSWSTDGKSFSYTVVKGSGAAVWIFSPQDKKSTVFAEKTGAFIGRSAFSPDGRWLTYESTETGQDEIFVQPFPATGAKFPIARGGWPFWSPDGRELAYNPGAGQIGFVGISTKPTFSFTQPRILTRLSGLVSRPPINDPRAWDFAPDGKRILGAADVAEQTASGTLVAQQIHVILNWFSELHQRVPVK